MTPTTDINRSFFERAHGGLRFVRGELIRLFQTGLINHGSMRGPADGIFGPATQKAIISFQQTTNMPITGVINGATWTAVTGTDSPSLKDRSLQLTADFEGHGYGKAEGDFDGCGLTWGIIGFTLKHGEVQKILNKISTDHSALLSACFEQHTDSLIKMLSQSLKNQMKWARSISVGRNKAKIHPEWALAFKKLGETLECQAIQLKEVDKYWNIAQKDYSKFNLQTEQGMALCFDIAVQNGGIDHEEENIIRQSINNIPTPSDLDIRLCIADTVAESSRPQYIEDVRRRKRTIASGSGTVHGGRYDTELWGISDIIIS